MADINELKKMKIWVCWCLSLDRNSGKMRKIPINPVTGEPARSNDPNTWGTYNQAVEARDYNKYSGIGYMFCPEAGIVGVDIDHCFDKETCHFNEIAAAILAKQPTYAEMSPSGTGIHLLYTAPKPKGGCRNADNGVEMYDNGRYFTYTGEKIEGMPDEISDGAETLKWILDTYIKKPKAEKANITEQKKGHVDRNMFSDEKVLEKAMSANDKGLFRDLFEGKWENHGYGSKSEADFALCRKLAFWTGKNLEQIDRLFRMSKLYGEKWDEKHSSDGTSYGQMTVSKAVEMTKDIFSTSSRSSVFKFEGMYYISKNDNVYPLTNFSVVPIDMIETEDETLMVGDLVTANGSYRKEWMTTDFSSVQKYKAMLNKSTIALAFFGSDKDLEQYKIYLSGLDWTRKSGVNAAGLYQRGDQLVFVCGNEAVDKAGNQVTDIIQMNRMKELESSILSAQTLTAEQMLTIGRVVLSYNEPAKTVPILAWAAGCFVKEHLRMKKIKFPMLFLIGEAGSGKSTTMEKVLQPIFSSSKVLAASQTTRFILMKSSASSNLIPIFMDEFKPSKIDASRINALYNHFRDSYDGHQGGRGNIDLSIRDFDLLAPMVVAGEEAADETAVRERSIELLFTKRDLKNPEYRESFQQITRMESVLNNLGRSLLQIALGTDPDTVVKWHEEMAERFDRDFPERVRMNLRSAYCGLKLIEALCTDLHLVWNEVFPYTLDQCIKYLEISAKEYLLDGSTHNKSIVDETFEIMSRMGLEPEIDYDMSDDGTQLYLRFPRVYDEYTRYRKEYAIPGEVLSYSEFRRQLRYSDLYIDNNVQHRMGGTNQKVWAIRYDLLASRSDVSGFRV